MSQGIEKDIFEIEKEVEIRRELTVIICKEQKLNFLKLPRGFSFH